jgi:hypothetical protein
MNKRVGTYKELLEERERLEALLKTQKEQLMTSASALKAEFQPAFSAISFLGTLVTRDTTNPILGSAANGVIDLVLKNVVLGRAGWIARNLIPLLVKNMSSHYIAEHETSIFRKIFSFFGIKKKKKTAETGHDKTNGQTIIN